MFEGMPWPETVYLDKSRLLLASSTMHATALIVVALLGCSEAIFQCKRNSTKNGYQTRTTSAWNVLPTLRPILELKPLVSVEGICDRICNDCNGPSTTAKPQDFIPGVLNGIVGGGDGGVVGTLLKGTPAECLGNLGIPLTGHQACLFPCILNLNLLDICDVTAILDKITALCPNLDYHALCVDACLCCGDDKQPQDACVEVCLTHSKGSKQGVNLPIIGNALPGANLLPQDILPGLPGANVASSAGKGKGGKDNKDNDNKGDHDDNGGGLGGVVNTVLGILKK